MNSIIRNKKSVFTAYIDLQKAFDFVDRELLLHKLLLNGIDGNVYNSFKSILANSESCIRINNRLTDWFSSSKGAKQEDSSSPTLFAIFINDLVKEINDLDIGGQVGDRKVSLLLYADDMQQLRKIIFK